MQGYSFNNLLIAEKKIECTVTVKHLKRNIIITFRSRFIANTGEKGRPLALLTAAEYYIYCALLRSFDRRHQTASSRHAYLLTWSYKFV